MSIDLYRKSFVHYMSLIAFSMLYYHVNGFENVFLSCQLLCLVKVWYMIDHLVSTCFLIMSMSLNVHCYYFFGFEHALVYYALSVLSI